MLARQLIDILVERTNHDTRNEWHDFWLKESAIPKIHTR